MEDTRDLPASADFFINAMTDLCQRAPCASVSVLDWGCGKGALVALLSERGVNARGCDFADRLGDSDALSAIEPSPYRLPFDDEVFDFVLSKEVLEHARNKEECFREIRRVLKPGGYAMHAFPAKWYLPTEPHIFVPLMNWCAPRRPRWWLSLWARSGARKPAQRTMSVREVVDENDTYLRDQTAYASNAQIARLSWKVFGNCEWPMRYYIDHASGGFGRLARRLPLRSVSGALSREFREAFLVQCKQP